uniref:Reverse transcriptase domain-containing protein n=1 Tax=Tanacetum cinerariifolium TaxID=118510 RepID=A0A699GVT6_TANCI|nr:hypothetical protein [Tanacetum cinerariifolium]
MAESAKRHKENSNIIKEIRASINAAIRNHEASIKTLEIQIGQMSKVLLERGIGGTNVSVMPFSTYTNLGLGILTHTRLTTELADRTIKQPRGITENVLVRIGKFIVLIYVIILDIPKDDDVPLILGRPFLSTAYSKIDVYKIKITLRNHMTYPKDLSLRKINDMVYVGIKSIHEVTSVKLMLLVYKVTTAFIKVNADSSNVTTAQS